MYICYEIFIFPEVLQLLSNQLIQGQMGKKKKGHCRFSDRGNTASYKQKWEADGPTKKKRMSYMIGCLNSQSAIQGQEEYDVSVYACKRICFIIVLTCWYAS